MPFIDFDSKWLQINIIEHKPKTKVFGIYSKKGEFLGLVQWRNGWRQYVLEPIRNTIWATSCLEDVTRFIKELMTSRICAELRRDQE